MKKNMLIIMVLALSVPLMAGASFGVAISHTSNQQASILSNAANPGCVVNISKNVSMGYTTDSATAADQQEYALGAYHTSGDKEYGTAYDTTIIKWSAKTDKVDLTAPTASNSAEYSGWTSM
jgi:hypothetical protein